MRPLGVGELRLLRRNVLLHQQVASFTVAPDSKAMRVTRRRAER